VTESSNDVASTAFLQFVHLMFSSRFSLSPTKM